MFDRLLMVDWSAAAAPTPKTPKSDAIFIGMWDKTAGCTHPRYHRTRASAMAEINARISYALSADERLLIGVDFGLGYPTGFAEALTGQARAVSVWNWLADHVEDDDKNANNRFELAAEVNAKFPGVGPFWGCPTSQDWKGLPKKSKDRTKLTLPEKRAAEEAVGGQSQWKLYTSGSVGSQTIMGMAHLAKLRKKYRPKLQVWPQDTGWEVGASPVQVAEIYPSMLEAGGLLDPNEAAWRDSDPVYEVTDARQVRGMCEAVAAVQAKRQLSRLFMAPTGLGNPIQIAREEGWILGAGVSSLPG